MGSLRKRGGIWWIRYYRNGRRSEESAHTDNKKGAQDLLKIREGDVAKGVPVSAKIAQFRFEDAAMDIIHDYRVNQKRSLAVLERRIELHLKPRFGSRRMATISMVDVCAYVAHRQAATEVVKKAYALRRPEAGEVRLDAHTTKNGEGRVFPVTPELRELLEEQKRQADDLKRTRGLMVRWVFFRMVAKTRGGVKFPRPIVAFTKVWANACVAAGCPGRIPHDLRRTAVRNLVRAGVSETVAMRLTGHKTRSVFDRYNIVSDGDLREAAVKLAAKAVGTKWGQWVVNGPADATPISRFLEVPFLRTG